MIDLTQSELKSYHYGHYYYAHGHPLERCHNDAMKRGWLAAKRAYEIEAAKAPRPAAGKDEAG